MDAVVIRKHADKSGPEPAPGEPWPLAGVSLSLGTGEELPEEFALPVKTVMRGINEGWITPVGGRRVERPSQAEPDYDQETGSATVATGHLFAAGTIDNPAPHSFTHLDALELPGLDGSVLRLTVVRQPDKYVAGDDEARVTREVYEAGDTVVDHHYVVRQEG